MDNLGAGWIWFIVAFLVLTSVLGRDFARPPTRRLPAFVRNLLLVAWTWQAIVALVQFTDIGK